MGKSKKKLSRDKREEEQGKRVLRSILIFSVIVAIALIIAFSVLS